jgi:hypothetical protein
MCRGGARILDWGSRLERSDIYYREKNIRRGRYTNFWFFLRNYIYFLTFFEKMGDGPSPSGFATYIVKVNWEKLHNLIKKIRNKGIINNSCHLLGLWGPDDVLD